MVYTSTTETGALCVGLNKTGPFRCSSHWRDADGNLNGRSMLSYARAYCREHGHAGVYYGSGKLLRLWLDGSKVRRKTYKPEQVRVKTIAEPTVITPRGFVVGCLWHSSVVRHLVPNDLWLRAYIACDGFGEVTATYASEVLCFDWSHVRDASDEAYKRAARVLRHGFRRLPAADRDQIYELLWQHYSEPLAA